MINANFYLINRTGDDELEWKLYDQNRKFLQDVNCQYDSCDVSRWEYNAKKINIDFDKKEVYIIEVEDEPNE
mgnify:CR=1 FL=1